MDMRAARLELLKISRDIISAPPSLIEQDGKIWIKTTQAFGKTQGPKLEYIGFYWNVAKKMWEINKDRMTPAKEKALKTILRREVDESVPLEEIKSLVDDVDRKLKNSLWFSTSQKKSSNADSEGEDQGGFIVGCPNKYIANSLGHETVAAGGKVEGYRLEFYYPTLERTRIKEFLVALLAEEDHLNRQLDEGRAQFKRLEKLTRPGLRFDEGKTKFDIKCDYIYWDAILLHLGQIKQYGGPAEGSSSGFSGYPLRLLTSKQVSDFEKEIEDLQDKSFAEQRADLEKRREPKNGIHILEGTDPMKIKCPWDAGDVVHNNPSWVRRGEPEWLTVVSSWEKYYAMFASRIFPLDHNYGRDTGTIYMATCRASTPEEIEKNMPSYLENQARRQREEDSLSRSK